MHWFFHIKVLFYHIKTLHLYWRKEEKTSKKLQQKWSTFLFQIDSLLLIDDVCNLFGNHRNCLNLQQLKCVIRLPYREKRSIAWCGEQIGMETVRDCCGRTVKNQTHTRQRSQYRYRTFFLCDWQSSRNSESKQTIEEWTIVKQTSKDTSLKSDNSANPEKPNRKRTEFRRQLQNTRTRIQWIKGQGQVTGCRRTAPSCQRRTNDTGKEENDDGVWTQGEIVSKLRYM